MSKTCTKNLFSGNEYVYLNRSATSGFYKYLKVVSLFVFFLFAVSNICYAQPINDDCDNAIELDVQTFRTYSEYTNQLATAPSPSLDIPAPSCGSYLGADVWFKVLVPSDGKLRIDGWTNVNPNIAIAVYRDDCNNLELYECSFTSAVPQSSTVRLDIDDDVLADEYLYIRVFRQGSTSGGTFKISCYENTTIAPVNDSCDDAILLTNEKRTFEFQTFTTTGAFVTLGAPSAGCIWWGKIDVWFKAIIPASGKLVVETNPGTINPEVEIYSGSCSGLVSEGCSSDGMIDDGGEIVLTGNEGDEILIRVASSDFTSGTFDIVVLEPSNDEFSKPILLENISEVEEYVAYTNQYADILNDGDEPTCGNFLGKDIWFKVKVPSNGELLIETKVDEVSNVHPVLTVFTDSSGTMSEYYACNFWGSMVNAFGAKIQIDEDTLANEYIYLRMYAHNNANGGVFRMATIQPSTLPVELTSFRSNVINNEEVQLDWSTASELNNDYFLIEHSVDGTNFTPVGRIDGKGTTSEQQLYQYVHDEPFFGVNYYRLKQIDFDGRFEYSDVVTAVIKMVEAKINLFPNPVNLTKGINVRWIGDFGRENTQLHITNSVGKLVYSQELDVKGRQQTYIDLSPLNLNAGMYHLTINDDNALITSQKIYLVKD